MGQSDHLPFGSHILTSPTNSTWRGSVHGAGQPRNTSFPNLTKVPTCIQYKLVRWWRREIACNSQGKCTMQYLATLMALKSKPKPRRHYSWVRTKKHTQILKLSSVRNLVLWLQAVFFGINVFVLPEIFGEVHIRSHQIGYLRDCTAGTV
jgi:hypothetical protein